MLISTHNVDEADTLRSRIALLHRGLLKSYATSNFLKNNFGYGNMEVTVFTEPSCDLANLENQLGGKGKRLELEKGKFLFTIPHTKQTTDALKAVRSKTTELGIKSMSVSVINLHKIYKKYEMNIFYFC